MNENFPTNNLITDKEIQADSRGAYFSVYFSKHMFFLDFDLVFSEYDKMVDKSNVNDKR